MTTLLDILTHDILPIFIGIGLGFFFGRRFRPDTQSLTRVTFHIFSPCLVFVSLTQSNLAGGELAQIAAFTAIAALMMGGLAWLVGRLLRLDAPSTAALMLVCMFVNGGNYGLGVNQRAFGDEGLARAVVYFVTSTVLVYTLGIAIASRSGNVRGAIRKVFEVPPVYAVIAALIVRALSIDMKLPALEPIFAGIEIISRATIPAMLIVLGIQLAQTAIRDHSRFALTASGLRLFVAPLVATGVAALVGLTGLTRQTSIVEASMPAAVFNIILATEYGAAPTQVTSSVALSTLISPFTLAIIISLLKA